jgi:hypothetical protein
MAIPRIKATYTLDADTLKMLDDLAHRWETSKSEALRLAIRAASAAESQRKAPRNVRTAALDRYQDSLALTETVASAWARHARAERRASSRKRGV